MGEPPEEIVTEAEGYGSEVKARAQNCCTHKTLETRNADDDGHEPSPDEDELPVDEAELKKSR